MHCGLVYDPPMIMVKARPRRAFQGWRYFDPADAPPDAGVWNGEDVVPDTLERELMALGLI
jgi:hypothetical protein